MVGADAENPRPRLPRTPFEVVPGAREMVTRSGNLSCLQQQKERAMRTPRYKRPKTCSMSSRTASRT